MVVDTIKENLCIHKLIATKKEIILLEGDMIVPDSKPDIINTICTSGVICLYRKEVLEGKIRLDGNINTYIMYMADDSKDKIRGLNTSLDFSEHISIPGCEENMSSQVKTKLKSIEAKVINGRKVGIKATMEVEINIFSNEETEIVNDIKQTDGIQMLKEDLKVNSLVGTGETKIYAKDTLAIDSADNLVEILKSNLHICDEDIKISYNKILTKSEVEVKIMYLTEDNRIGMITSKIPVVGFIDIPNVSEENICDVNYEIKNVVLKPNSVEEHSIYVEIEIGVMATVFEEKQINVIQDLYSPCENLEFNKKKITTMTNKRVEKNKMNINEKITLEDMGEKSILDVDIVPVIEKQNNLQNRIVYEGEIQLNFILSNQELDIDNRMAKIPFEYTMENQNEECSNDLNMEVASQDFIIQENGQVTANINMNMNSNSYENTRLNLIEEIQTNGEREAEDYSLLMYFVKKDDTLWKIAKRFGSTVDDIARTNGIEDENKIYPGQKLFIPHYSKVSVEQHV